MTRPTLQQLYEAQQDAASIIKRGSHYMHLASRKVYEIMGHCICESRGVPLVLYQHEVGDPLFARPVEEFLESVEYPNEVNPVVIQRRFVEVVKRETWDYV